LAVAVAASINPLFLMIPATRLFVRSPSWCHPHGNKYGYFRERKVTIQEMAKCGLGLNLMSIILLTALLYFVIILYWVWKWRASCLGRMNYQ
jgi:sodium-dependent dicarboxylate transporter 2/3/5